MFPRSSNVSLNRRRGTSGASSKSWVILSSRALFLLAALCLTIFSMGLLLGTHLEPGAAQKSNNSAGTLSTIESGAGVASKEQQRQQKQLEQKLLRAAQENEELEENEKEQIVEEEDEEETDDIDDESKPHEELDKIINTKALEVKKESESEMKLRLMQHEKSLNEHRKEEPSEEELEQRLNAHLENVKNPPKEDTDNHPLLRNSNKASLTAPKLIQIKPIDYFYFSMIEQSSTSTIQSVSLPHAIESNPHGLAISTWIYLQKAQLPANDAIGSRTILSSPLLSCNEDQYNGWNIYINSPNTEDEQLIIEYASYQHSHNVRDDRTPFCRTLVASGYQIPIETWTHIGVSYHLSSGLKLYLNGVMVAEDTKSDIVSQASTVSEKNVMIVGQSATKTNSLEGNIAMMMIFNGLDLSPKDMGLLYEAGVNLSILQATGTLIQNKYDSSDVFLYDFSVNEKRVGRKSNEIQDKFGNSEKNGILHTSPTAPPKKLKFEQDLISNEDFAKQIEKYTPLGGRRYQEYKDGTNTFTPLSAEEKERVDNLARTRRHHIREGMKHVWNGYRSFAWGMDELLPHSKKGHNNWGGMGTTLVDSLDTLWLMGLKDEFYEARDWCRDSLTFDHTGAVSVFETTIRSLGGLLSAYDWSEDEIFLEKAKDLGKRLFHAFQDNPSGLPFGQTVLNGNRSYNINWLGRNVLLAEVGTLQIEFRYLGRVAKNHEYEKKANDVFEILSNMKDKMGLYPYKIDNSGPTPHFTNSVYCFGAMADSFYEYLLKVWLQGGKKETKYREMYDKAMDGMHEKLLFKSKPDGLTYIADLNGNNVDHKMDHLACFMAGSLALGAYTDPNGLDSTRAQRDLKTGKALAYTCYQMYARMNTGISAEAVRFNQDSNNGEDIKPFPNAPFYILRPETVESFFILNYLTGDPTYREWGWEIFQSIEKYSRTEVAYGSIHNVNDVNANPENRMESFFLAETMKYLYLLQDPDTEVDILHKHVFNTEAHPMRIFSEMEKSNTGR